MRDLKLTRTPHTRRKRACAGTRSGMPASKRLSGSKARQATLGRDIATAPIKEPSATLLAAPSVTWSPILNDTAIWLVSELIC